MPSFTTDSFAAHLTRALAPHCGPGERPRAVTDTDDKGRTVLEFTLPNPHESRHSVSLTVSEHRGTVTSCALWFGPVEIAGYLIPEDALPAIEEIVAGNMVAVARYKTRDAYDSRRKASSGGIQWVYQLPDDRSELDALLDRLKRPAGLFERIGGGMTGVFEVFRWDGCEVIER